MPTLIVLCFAIGTLIPLNFRSLEITKRFWTENFRPPNLFQDAGTAR